MARSLLQGFFSIAGARVGRMALYIALTPVIVRVLGPAYGDYVFVISVLSMVMVLSNGGVFTATRKYISEHRDLEDWEDDVFAFYVHVSAAFVVLVAVAGAFVADKAARAVGSILLSRWLPFGIDVGVETLELLSWIALVGGVVCIAAAYRTAIRRIGDYRVQ